MGRQFLSIRKKGDDDTGGDSLEDDAPVTAVLFGANPVDVGGHTPIDDNGTSSHDNNQPEEAGWWWKISAGQ